MPDPHPPKVGLFATCFVDLYRPSVARAKLQAGSLSVTHVHTPVAA